MTSRKTTLMQDPIWFYENGIMISRVKKILRKTTHVS